MANFKRLAMGAKKLVDQAGGPEALKDKAGDLKKIATGKGSVADKAKAAAAVVRTDEATGEESGEQVKAGDQTSDPSDAAKPDKPAEPEPGPPVSS